MKKNPFVLPFLGATRAYAATCLDTSSPAAYRTSVTKMADEAGRGNYGHTRAALLDALHKLQNQFVADYLEAEKRSWGKLVEAQASFDAMMKGKSREQIFDMAKAHGELH